MAPSGAVNGGSPVTRYICIRRPRFAYLLYNFHGATMTINGILQVSKGLFSQFLAQNLAGSRDL